VWNYLIDPHTWFLQIQIAQRGAIKPLIDMLESSDLQLKEMSTFALGRLAQVIITSNHDYLYVEIYSWKSTLNVYIIHFRTRTIKPVLLTTGRYRAPTQASWHKECFCPTQCSFCSLSSCR
jgi:hypothetical protein